MYERHASYYLLMEGKFSVTSLRLEVVSVPDPKPTPARIAFSVFLHAILEAIYVLDEVSGRD